MKDNLILRPQNRTINAAKINRQHNFGPGSARTKR